MAIQAWPSRLPILKKSSFFRKPTARNPKMCEVWFKYVLFWGQLPGRCKLFVSKALINQIFHVQNGIRTARNVRNHVLPRPGCAPDVALPNAAALLVVNASVVAEHIDPTIPCECQTTVLDKIQWTWDCKNHKGPPKNMFTSFSLQLVLVQDLVLAGFGPSRLTRPRTPCFCFLGVPTYTLDQTNWFGCPPAHLLFFGNLSGGCCSFQNHSTSSLISWLAAGSNRRRDDWKIEKVPALLQRACACVWKLRALKFMALLYYIFTSTSTWLFPVNLLESGVVSDRAILLMAVQFWTLDV